MEKLLTVENLEVLLTALLQKLGNILPGIFGAVIFAVAGVWICRFIRRFADKLMTKRNVEPTVQTFVNQFLKWVLYIALFLAIVQKLGVPTSSFLGALTAAGVAVGLALQGSLANFAGGIMLLILKPFRAGDVIEAKGERGTVQQIGLFYTTLSKFGNEHVSIPNGPLFADNIINYSKEPTRRAKIMVGISYNSDIRKAKQILMDIALAAPLVEKDPEPVVFVEELADSSVNLSVRIWTLTPDYWQAYFYMVETIKMEFDKAGIEIPFPQRDVNLKYPPQK